MRSSEISSRVLCLVLCVITVLFLAVPVNASHEDVQTQLRPAVAVRYSAKPDSLVIGYLEDGTELQVLKTYDSCYQISCYDMTGYIDKDFVRVEFGRYYVNYAENEGETRVFSALPIYQASILRQALCADAEDCLGVRYRWGGTTPKGFDCSGLVQYVFRKSGIALERTCETQISDGIIIPKEELRYGDLVFFRGTHGGSPVTHVGLYIGDGKMIHSSRSGVEIASVNARYYAERYLCARRVVLDYLPQIQAVEARTMEAWPAAVNGRLSEELPLYYILVANQEEYWYNQGIDYLG